MNDERQPSEPHLLASRLAGDASIRLATEAAGIGVWSWNTANGQVDWSETMYDLFLVPRSSLVTMETCLERIHPRDRSVIREATERLAAGNIEEADRPLHYRILLPDGRTRWIAGRGRIVDEDGQRVMHGVASDVTEQKRAEERLSFLAEASHILSSSLDFHETLTQVAELVVPELADWCAVDLLDDRGLLRRLAVAHQDPSSVRWARELEERYPTGPGSLTHRVARTGEPVLITAVSDAVLREGARDEEHLALLREVGFSSVLVVPLISRGETLGVLLLIQAESGRHFDEDDLELARQLAERAALAVDNARLYGEAQRAKLELEERVEQRTTELRAAQKELDDFTYSASHDLRAPLRGIAGFAQVLLEDYGAALDDTARSHIGRIALGAARMGWIIDALLGLSRLGQAQLQRTRLDLSAKAREAIARLRVEEPDREVEIMIEEDLTASGDSDMVRLLLDNLLGNAWKFTRGCAPARIEVGVVGRSGERVFFVRDNGVGFDMAFASKLFEPFGRLHSPQEFDGPGIGLPTVQRIIHRHGGRIWAESEPGKGATFYFTLPRSAQPPAG